VSGNVVMVCVSFCVSFRAAKVSYPVPCCLLMGLVSLDNCLRFNMVAASA